MSLHQSWSGGGRAHFEWLLKNLNTTRMRGNISLVALAIRESPSTVPNISTPQYSALLELLFARLGPQVLESRNTESMHFWNVGFSIKYVQQISSCEHLSLGFGKTETVMCNSYMEVCTTLNSWFGNFRISWKLCTIKNFQDRPNAICSQERFELRTFREVYMIQDFLGS